VGGAVVVSRPWLWATIDEPTGLALVRGPEARRTCRLLAPEDCPPRWSAAGRGWVVPVSVVADLQAYAQMIHTYITVSTRQDVP
jgi:hypothetical protein